MRETAKGTCVAGLLEGVFGAKRRLHKRVLEFSFYQTPELYRLLARRPYTDLLDISRRLIEITSQKLGVTCGPTDLLIDAPPVHKEVEFKVSIFHSKENCYRPLSQVSPVVAALAKTQFDDYVKRVRIFAEPELAQAINRHTEFSKWLEQAASSCRI